ncbi:class I SAM-dependent methyltransferase [Candidatus Peribacteria bacterium]|nr:class I SAM-dependent methyltransferase [Candidatus Peribacteria bacterium]
MAMLRCPGCGLLWLQQKILEDTHYHSLDIGVNDAKAVRRKRNVADRVRTIGGYIPLDSTCDIGTGDGAFLQALGDSGYQRCWGIEPSQQGAEFGTSHGLDVIQGTIDSLPALAEQKKPAVITLFHVIEHLDHPKKDLETLFNALPSGGHLVLETPNLRGYSPRTIGYAWELFYPEHLWYFDDRTLPKLLQSVGFQIVASGIRDFDMAGKGIGELLFRLGLKKGSKKKLPAHTSGSKQANSPPSPSTPSLPGLGIIRWVLRLLVQWRGNVDYVWVIAKKP